MTIPAKTTEDFVKALSSYLPTNWVSPAEFERGTLTRAVFEGLGGNDLHTYDVVRAAGQQLTLLTAEGTQVDDIVRDYFGNNLPRYANESDASYVARVVNRMFRPTGTRTAVLEGVKQAIGTDALLLENQRAATAGPWRADYDMSPAIGQLAYDTAGVYDPQTAAGQFAGAYQCLMTVYQPEPTSAKFLTRLQIMALITELKPLGTTVWVRLVGPDSTGGVPVD